MKRLALFPGSFDPFTRGHESLVRRSLDLFDGIVVGIGVNSNKNYLFTLEERKQMISQLFKNESRVSVESYQGLTVNFCAQHQIRYILRGLRNPNDVVFESEIAGMNKVLNSEIESIFLTALPEFSAINSTIVREIYKNGGDVSGFLPAGMKLPAR